MDDTIFIRICGIITCVIMFALIIMVYKEYIEIIQLIKDGIHETEKLKKSTKYYDSEQLDYINYGDKVDYYDRRINK